MDMTHISLSYRLFSSLLLLFSPHSLLISSLYLFFPHTHLVQSSECYWLSLFQQYQSTAKHVLEIRGNLYFSITFPSNLYFTNLHFTDLHPHLICFSPQYYHTLTNDFFVGNTITALQVIFFLTDVCFYRCSCTQASRISQTGRMTLHSSS